MGWQKRAGIIVAISGVCVLIGMAFVSPLQPVIHDPLPTLASLPAATQAPGDEAVPTTFPAVVNSAALPDAFPLSDDAVALRLPRPDPVPGQIILHFDPTMTAAMKARYLAQIHAQSVVELPALESVVITLAAGQSVAQLPPSALVTSEADYFVQAQSLPQPNDPLYPQQWGLQAVGLPSWWGLPTNRTETTVAVIDSGVCLTHPDLQGALVAGWNFVADDADVTDTFGHGCAVAGILAAQMNNGVGMVGAVPDLRIMPLRVLDEHGQGRYSDVAAAIVYAVDHGVPWINLSVGGVQSSTLLENAVRYATDHHVTLVAAAGNGGSASLLYPAAYPAVIAVGSVDANLQRSAFSNYGAGLDVFAPGRDIISTRRDNTYGRVSGTSFATPLVTGALILAQATGQTLTFNSGLLRLDGTPDPIDPPPPPPVPSISGVIAPEVYTTLAQTRRVHVMIALNLPPSAQSLDDPTPMIAQAQQDVLAQLNPDEFVVAQQYVTIAALAGTLSREGLAQLENNPVIARIYIDEPIEAASATSVITINADDVQTGAVSGLTLTGAGLTVAVIDSGIDMTNPAVSDDVVAQKCFSSVALCPGHVPTSDTAPDSSLHGTNIAAIITAPEGVAPDANIVAIRVLDDYGRGLSSDWVAALDWIAQQVQNDDLEIDVVNMSLGSQRLYKPAVGSSATSCSQVFPAEAIAVQNVLSLGIPIFAATGNQGSIDSINSPACIAGVTAIGAIYDRGLGAEPDTGTYHDQLHGSWPNCADTTTTVGQITCFTNSNEWLDLVAPGAQIIIGGTGGSGTSQASPHAAGVAALMLQGHRLDTTPSDASPASLEAILRSTGPFVTDTRNGLVFRQLDAYEAVNQLVNPVHFTSCASIIGVSRAECEALVALYLKTDGAHWSTNTNWMKTSAPCTWFGVTCTGTSVTGLDLNGSSMTGVIPSEIAGLQNLRTLNLNDATGLTGGLAYLGTLTNLQELRLDNLWAMHANFPPEWGALTQLETLSMHNSTLTGPLPAQIGSMTALKLIDLSGDAAGANKNQMMGSLPSQLNQLTKLEVLDLQANAFSGTLPNLSGLTKLQYINFNYNSLIGALPATLTQLPELVRLYASVNQLSGTLPTVWNAKLQYIEIDSNQFSGPLPSAWSSLSNLVRLNVSYNQLTGSVPTFSSSVSLSAVYLGHNQLTTIPTSIGNYASLVTLDLSYNNFTTLPAQIGGLTALTSLSLDHNHIAALPASFTNLSSVATLTLNYNQLTTLPAALTSLPLTSVNFCYNRIDSSSLSQALIDFITAHQPTCGSFDPWYTLQVIPPNDVTATVVSANSVRLSWTRPALAFWKYEIYYAPVSGGALKKHGEVPYVQFGTGLPVTYLVTNLLPNTAYQFSLQMLGGDESYSITSVMGTPVVAAATQVSTCNLVQAIPVSECQGLEAFNNAVDTDQWLLQKPRWMNVDNPRLLVPASPTSFLIDLNGGGWVVRYPHGSSVYDAEFNASGTEVVTSGADAKVQIWNAATGASLGQLDVVNSVVPTSTNSVVKAVYNPSGTRIATLSTDNTLRLWNRATQTEVWRSMMTYTSSYGAYAFSLNLQFNAAGTQMLVSDYLSGARLRNVSDGSQIRVFQAGSTAVIDSALSPDASRVVTADADGSVRLWNTATGELLNTFAIDEAVQGAVFNSDGTRLLVRSSHTSVSGAIYSLSLLNSTTGAQIWQYVYPLGSASPSNAVLIDNNTHVMAHAGNTIAILDASTGAFVRELLPFVYAPEATYGFTSLAYDPVQTLVIGLYPCTWPGITCQNGHVTELQISGLHVYGNIPPQLANLTELKTLDLSNNGLTHGVPPELGSLSKLQTLNLSGSFYESWVMPPELGNLTSLETLDLYNGYVRGLIPTELGQLSALKTLNLSANGQIDSTIPSSLGSLSKLETLNLAYNTGLKGAIPPQLASLSKLRILDVRNTALSGTIPPQLGSLAQLREFYASNTQLTGGIPTTFSGLSKLEVLLFQQNSLMSGPLPAELGTLTNLKTLTVSQSGLTGSIPTVIGSLSNLEVLDLSNNILTGAIPASLGQLTAAKQIILNNNRLTGAIPTTLNQANLPNLNGLILSGNELQGDIPVELTTFTSGLGAALLHNNRLSSSNPTVRAYFDLWYGPGWWRTQTTAPLNLQLADVTSGSATLKWQPQCDDANTLSSECALDSGFFEVLCAAILGGPYTSMGRTLDTNDHQLTLRGLDSQSTSYCVVRAASMDLYQRSPIPLWWYSDNSSEIQVVTTAPWGLEVPVDVVPAIIEAEFPDAQNVEDHADVCSQESGRAMSFRGSGRAMSFRGSGRAMSFRGSGDAQVLFAKTGGSTFDTVLTVWRVPVDTPFSESNLSLQFLGCNDNLPIPGSEAADPNGVERPPDSPSYASGLTVPFDRNFDLYFIVFAKNNEAGGVRFTLDGNDQAPTGLPASQVQVLSMLYSATNGSGWTQNIGWFSASDPCTWYGVTCTASTITGLNLAGNKLSGPLPAEMGSLTDLTTLDLHNNALQGALPSTLAALTQLTTLDLSYNALTASGAALAFADTHDAGWAQTQTVPPTIIQVSGVSNDQANLTFTPIAYTSDGGFYAASCALQAGGPYSLNAHTASKATISLTLTDLLPGTAYFCTLRTSTPAHGAQTSALLSEKSAEFSLTTSLPSGISGSNGVYVIIPPTVFPLVLQMNTRPLPTVYDPSLPVPPCGAAIGKALVLRGSGETFIGANSGGSDYAQSLSVWRVASGQPLSQAVALDCADSQTGDRYAGASIPAGEDYVIIVAGQYHNGGTLSLLLKDTGEAPLALSNSYSLDEDSPLTIQGPGVLKNDINLSNSLLALSVITPPTHGTLLLYSNGGFTYTSTLNYFGLDSFVYQISDGQHAPSSATVALTLTPQQDAPLISDDSVKANQNTPTLLPVLSNDTEPDGEALTLLSVSASIHGANLNINIGGGTLTYTPPLGYIGPDSFSYTACDPHAACGVAHVSVIVRPVTGALTLLTLPIQNGNAVNETAAGLEGQRPALWLGNNQGPSYLALRVTDLLIPQGAVVTSAQLQVYSPQAQTTPLNVLLAVEASDDSQPFSLQTPPSQRPVSSARVSLPSISAWNAAGWYTLADVAPLLQDIVNRPGWQSGHALTLMLRGMGQNRQKRIVMAAVTSDFAPRLVITFTYPNANLAPLAVNDRKRTPQNTPIISAVLSNDSDPNDDVLHLGTVGIAAHGSASANGDGTITYTPANGFIGTDTIPYSTCDPSKACTPALLIMQVVPAPGVPITLTIPVTYGLDDANDDGLRLINAPQMTWLGQSASGHPIMLGLRFADLPVPPGSVISAAHLEVYSPLEQTAPLAVVIAAEASDNSASFGITRLPAQRPLTSARAPFVANSLWGAGTWQTLNVDLAPLVQEVVNRSGWQYEQALALLLRGTGSGGRRVLTSYEANPTFAPRLVITFVPAAMSALGWDETPDEPTPVDENIITLGMDEDPFADVELIPPSATLFSPPVTTLPTDIPPTDIPPTPPVSETAVSATETPPALATETATIPPLSTDTPWPPAAPDVTEPVSPSDMAATAS